MTPTNIVISIALCIIWTYSVADESDHLPSLKRLYEGGTYIKDEKPPNEVSKAKANNTAASEQSDVDQPDYPEPDVVYLPKLPSLGQYSLPDSCQAIHDESSITVTLADGEKLQDAYARLMHKSKSLGGVLQVPWNIDTVQCDSLRTNRNKSMPSFTLKGLTGPNGEQPRFYCRRDERQGSIPKKMKKEALLVLATPRGLVENIHIDGYQTSIKLPSSGHIVIRNNYMHHAMTNGLVYSNSKKPLPLNLEICGNEISHSGRGNAEHGLYLHRNLTQEGSADVTFIDNLCHSTPFSSCYKSIANKNTLINNRFYQSKDTDPSYEKQYSSMLVDISSCAENLIEGNEFHGHKPKPTNYGDILIATRNRKTIMNGCDRPPYNSDEFWDPEYWKSLNQEILFKTIVRDNKFTAGPDYGNRLFAITAFGTFPNEALRSFGPAKLLEAPQGWYERSRIYTSGNTYSGFSAGHLYRNSPPGHCKAKQCGPPPAMKPDRNLIEVGEGETTVPLPAR